MLVTLFYMKKFRKTENHNALFSHSESTTWQQDHDIIQVTDSEQS